MDHSRQNDRPSYPNSNPPQGSASGHVNYSAPAPAPANGAPPGLPPPAQIAKTGGIGLATTIGSHGAAASQNHIRNGGSDHAQSVANPQYYARGAQQAPQAAPVAAQHTQSLPQSRHLQQGHPTYVPNPLPEAGHSRPKATAGDPVAPQQPTYPSQVQIQPHHHPQHRQHHQTSAVGQHHHAVSTSVSMQGRQNMTQSNAGQYHARPVPLQPYGAVPAPVYQQQRQQVPSQPSQQLMKNPAVTVQSRGPNQKPKVVLSPQAKSALAQAIWSAIRDPNGQIRPDLMQAALNTGLPKSAILNAARVAREREAQKRQQMRQQQRQQQQPQGEPRQAPPPQVNQRMQSVQQSRPQPQRPAPKPAPQRSAPAPAPKSKPSGPTPQQILQAKIQRARIDERSKWNRMQYGVFVLQKGKFLAPPHALGAAVRSDNTQPVIGITDEKKKVSRKRPARDVLLEAAELQRQFIAQKTNPVTPLLEPERFKRIKVEAKRHAKALDRVVKRARQTAVDALLKQHKEFSKAIASHQADFFKFHKARRAEALKTAKMIRDSMDKESKKKEKDAVAAERARLAALKANDMDAYSKLLEETKNDRLKFLMDKTEKHFSQISTSLLQHRNKDGSVASTGGTSSYYASAHLKTEEVRQPSILVGGDLKEYQMGGLQWLVSLYNNKLNGILADEMGLGKTIQAISLVAYLMELKGNLGPYLVIVPLSTLSNWVNEFQKWCPSAHVICYKGTPGQRKEIYREQVKNGHFNVLLTTYEYIIKDKASLRKIVWQYAIVDEGHRMKNSASKFAKTLATQYETKFRLLLTGTPLMNDLGELWSLLNFLLPNIFNSVDTFDQWFNRPFSQFGTSNEDDQNNLTNEERMFIIHRLHELLRPFMLRRVKSEVLDQLPEKVEKILRCDLSSWQKELYKQISKKAVQENGLAGTGVAQPQVPSRGLNNVVMQLRKVCNHPYLFASQGYQLNENVIRSSGKFALLDQMLPKLKAAGHRVLMFTQMTAVMTILEDYFTYRGYLSLRLDGSTPAEEREKRMYKYNAPDSPYFIFLLSTRAGGLGLNLTAANTVIIFDSDWNPMMDLQAQDRAHRIGQRSDVSVFRLVTHSPVEEKILSRATEKLNMSELVVEAGQFDKRSVENDNSLERKKLMEVLLTDFESNNASKQTTEDKAASEVTSENGDDDNDDEGDDDSEASKEEDLNELLSNNESDYRLYKAFDDEKKHDPYAVDATLFTKDEDIPDWVKHPAGRKSANAFDISTVADGGPRKRKDVVYDDGMTEKQFMRAMDKQYDAENTGKGDMKPGKRGGAPGGPGGPTSSQSAGIPGSELTDWTYRKLITCTKAVIALKDPATKRRLADVFLDKPSPEQFPDYYEMIQKPMAINDILRKCRGKLYANMREYREDWRLMLANAKTFNGAESWVVKDGEALEKELERVLKKNGFGDDAPKKPPPPKKKLRIKLSLKSLKAKDGSA